MDIFFTSDGWNDYQYWVENDADLLEKLNVLIKAIKRDPFKGIGKPEPLKNDIKGFWSRRITREHRLVYKIKVGRLEIIQCRLHY